MVLFILKFNNLYDEECAIYDKIYIPEGLIEDYHCDALTEAEFEDELQRMFENYIEENNLNPVLFSWMRDEEEYYEES